MTFLLVEGLRDIFVHFLPIAPNLAEMFVTPNNFDFCRAPKIAPPGAPSMGKSNMAATKIISFLKKVL